ncbi:hypothetical protein [Streptococcus parasuis]|uniref:hypothetical protein n=1 Tax=Streptococcus parasuis TaxID=1501662 RepID=UPI00370D7863
MTEKKLNPRIQGRVTPENYELYKKTKKEYIQKTGEIITDGDFLLLCLNAYIEKNKD